MYQNELYHHGVKGQKWGVRRYQNYDGTSKQQREFQARKNLKTAGANLYRVENKTKDKHQAYRNEVIKQSIKEISKAEKILGKKQADKYLAAGYRNQGIKNAAIQAGIMTGAAYLATMGLATGMVAGVVSPNAYMLGGNALMNVGRAGALATAGVKGYRAGTQRQRISQMTGRKFKS